MPFTFSHPAIILPLFSKKNRLSITGLIAGSMVPDFEFYFRMQLGENIGHHWPGFILFDIPMALILCFVYHSIIRNILIDHLPGELRSRLQVFTGFNWTRYAGNHKITVLISVIAGAITHVMADAFTHYDGFFVERFALLQSGIPVFGTTIAIYDCLQVLSSIAGLWLVIRFIKRLPKQNETGANEEADRFLFWASMCMITIMVVLARVLAIPQFNGFWDVFFAVIGAGIYALLIQCIFSGKIKLISWLEQ